MRMKRNGKQGARPSPGNMDIFGEAAVDFVSRDRGGPGRIEASESVR